MARIIEKPQGTRRTIKMSVDDIISVVREYQRIVRNVEGYERIREVLKGSNLFIPEDV